MKVYDKVWSTAPFIRSKMDSSTIMREVMIALTFVAVASVLLFGYAPLVIFAIAFSTGGLIVLLSGFFYSSFYFNSDTWKVSVLIFCLSLPPTAPWYVVIVGVITILFMSKWLFAIGSKNVFNPALIGRIVVMTLFSNDMATRWVFPIPKLLPLIRQTKPELSFIQALFESMHVIAGRKEFSFDSNLLQGADTLSGVSMPMYQDAISGPTGLTSLKNFADTQTELPWIDMLDVLFGNRMGAIGETSILIICIAFLYLVIKKIIDPWIPLIYIATIWLLTYIFGGLALYQGLFYFPASLYVFYGSAFFVAVFMLTDYGSTPVNKKARYILALAAAIIVVIGRIKDHYGDPQTYTLLFLNFMAPFLEKVYRSKPYAQIYNKFHQTTSQLPIMWNKIILGMFIILMSYIGSQFLPIEEFQTRKEHQNQQILRSLFDNYIVQQKFSSNVFQVTDEYQEPLDVVFSSKHGYRARHINMVIVFQGNKIKDLEILPPFDETRGIGDKLYAENWEKNLIGLTVEDLDISVLDLSQYAIDVISGATETTSTILAIVKHADEERKKYIKSVEVTE
ncbi:MAG: RnfABCDGE type electron transport complex subunit D [Brevinema sp.]